MDKKKFREFFVDDTNMLSMMRLGAFIAIIGIGGLTLSAILVAIIAVCKNKEFMDKAAEIIKSLGLTISTLGTVILYKAVQTFGEIKGQKPIESGAPKDPKLIDTNIENSYNNSNKPN